MTLGPREMLVALADVRFHCPSCGAALRTRPRDAGTVIACHLCGESVRAPRTIPSAEATPTVSAISFVAAARGVAACRLLLIAHALVIMQVIVVTLSYVAWASWLGPAKLFERDPGACWNALLPFWLADLTLLFAQTFLKLRAHYKLRSVAQALDGQSWLMAANGAVLARCVGYSLATLPWLMACPLEVVPMVWKAIAQVGHLAWLLGLVTEFAVLGLWYRVLAELSVESLDRTVTRYFAICLGVMMVISAGLSLTLIALVAGIRKLTPELNVPIGNGARLNFAALPAEDYWPVLALGLMTITLGSGLAALYTQLLRRVQSGFKTLI